MTLATCKPPTCTRSVIIASLCLKSLKYAWLKGHVVQSVSYYMSGAKNTGINIGYDPSLNELPSPSRLWPRPMLARCAEWSPLKWLLQAWLVQARPAGGLYKQL